MILTLGHNPNLIQQSMMIIHRKDLIIHIRIMELL